MRVLCLLGSPRRGGNSETLARWVAEPLAAAGAEAAFVRLNDLAARGCQACMACKTTREACALDDDLTPVLEQVRACDVLVLATPVYYGDVTAQMKLFIDRTFSFLVPGYGRAEQKTRLPRGKRCAMVVAQGHPREDLFADIPRRYGYFFERYLGFESFRLLRACGIYDRGDAAARDDLRREAEALAADLRTTPT
ncbi:MAG: flavodoxin family protein [Desulfovibrionaceae bacterium]